MKWTFSPKKSKQKNIFKLSEKKLRKHLPFHDALDHFVSISQMHLRQRFPYIIKDDSIEGL